MIECLLFFGGGCFFVVGASAVCVRVSGARLVRHSLGTKIVES